MKSKAQRFVEGSRKYGSFINTSVSKDDKMRDLFEELWEVQAWLRDKGPDHEDGSSEYQHYVKEEKRIKGEIDKLR